MGVSVYLRWGKGLKPLRVAGLYALVLLLLFCAASIWLESARGAATVYPSIEVPGAVYADVPFDITLHVTRDPTIQAYVDGYLYLDTVPVQSFGIYFDSELVWESPPITMSLSAGEHKLIFCVDYLDVTDPYNPIPGSSSVEASVFAVRSLKVVWLQRPDEGAEIRAGKLIRFRFRILDEISRSFVLPHDVRIEVRNSTDDLIVEATCGKGSGSIHINTHGEYYRWYWKTTRDLPEGDYYVIVLLSGADFGSSNSIQIRIVS